MGEHLRGISLVCLCLALLGIIVAVFALQDVEGSVPPPGTPVENPALPTCQDYVALTEYERIVMWLQHLPVMLEDGGLDAGQWSCMLDPLRIQELDRDIIIGCKAGTPYEKVVFTSLKAYMEPCELTLYREE
jgi:hypothetical protein